MEWDFPESSACRHVWPELESHGRLGFVRYPVGLYFGLCTSAGLTSARDKNRMHRQVFATAIHNGNDRSCSNPPLKSLLTFSAGPRSVVAGRSLQHRQVAATGYAIKLPVHVTSRPGVSSSTSCLHDGRATSQIPVAAWQQLEALELLPGRNRDLDAVAHAQILAAQSGSRTLACRITLRPNSPWSTEQFLTLANRPKVTENTHN